MKSTLLARLLAGVSGLVDQQLLHQNEYLITENRILHSQLETFFCVSVSHLPQNAASKLIRRTSSVLTCHPGRHRFLHRGRADLAWLGHLLRSALFTARDTASTSGVSLAHAGRGNAA